MDQSTLFGAVALALVAGAIIAFLADRLLVAGVCMLGTTFAIYLRETRG